MRIIAKATEIIETTNPTDSTEFTSQEKYTEAGLLAVKFEQRFPAQPPFPTEPHKLSESPRFANRKKKVSELTMMDWEWIRMIQQRTVENNKIKRTEERTAYLEKITEQDAHSFEVYQMEAQKFRIFMTWLERMRAEKRHRQLRTQHHLEFIEEIQERRKDIRQFIRIENFLVRRKKGLESPVPPPPVKYQIDEIRQEMAYREKIKDQRKTMNDFFLENMRNAQAQVANLLLKKNLSEQSDREDADRTQTDSRYMVHKVKQRK